MPVLVTKSELSRELDIDSRRQVFDRLHPVAQAKLAGNKLVPLYNKAEAVAFLAAELARAVAKFEAEDKAVGK